MKTALLTLLALAIFFVSKPILAAEDCGGVIQYTEDCANNGRHYKITCCPDGYRVQGVAYNDIKGQDHTDAVSAVCRNIARGNDTMPTDFGRSPKKFVCDNNEVMAGILSKDVITDSGDKRDTLDGVTAICQHPGSTNLRILANKDIDSNTRHGRELTVLLPKRVVGIAYKELDKGTSDRADCVTIITK
jgi:hypothetical protein